MLRTEPTAVGCLHAHIAFGSVRIKLRRQVGIKDRDKRLQRRAPHEPLEVRPPGVVIWTVEAGSWDDLDEPAEEVLMAGVHTNRDRRLPAVSSEATFSYEHAYEETDVEAVRGLLGQRTSFRVTLPQMLLHRIVSRETCRAAGLVGFTAKDSHPHGES